MTTTARILPPLHANCEPNAVWDEWVGSQTPDEFRAGGLSVDDYVDSVPDMFPELEPPLTDEERANLIACLCHVLIV